MKRLPIVLLAILVAPTVAANGHVVFHEDYFRGLPLDESAIREAAQQVLSGAEGATGNLTRAQHAAAGEHADASADAGERLAVAAALPLKKVDLPPVLHRIAAPADALGSTTVLLVEDFTRLQNASVGPARRALAQAQLEAGVETALGTLGVFEAEGFDTTRLRTLLGRLLEDARAVTIPPEADASVDEDAAPGAVVRVIVWDPANAGGLVAVDAFDGTTRGRLDANGSLQVDVRVPTGAAAGRHDVNVTWPGGNVTLPVHVAREPTELTLERATRATGGVTLTVRLTEARSGVSLPDAVLTRDGDGNVTTAADGRASLRVDPDVVTVRIAFPGNDTHAPATLTWRNPDPVVIDPLEEMFRQVGYREPPVAPVTPWWLVGVVWLVVAVAAVPGVRQARDAVALVARGMRRTAAPTGEAPLPPDGHPLVEVLRSAGHPVRVLTLREAEAIWDDMGAPAVRAWTRAHERAYYRDRGTAPLPHALVAWARGLLA